MGHPSLLTRTEIEALGPPIPDELADLGLPESCLHNLALKCLASLHQPTSVIIAEKLQLPTYLAEELLYHLYREELIEMRLQRGSEATRYSMLERGWERVREVQAECGYTGPAPVSLTDYSHMMRLQSSLRRPVSMARVRSAFRDLVLPESLLHTLACVINSRSSLLLSGESGTGKTAIAQRMNTAVSGAIWIPYAIDMDGQIIRVFDEQCHKVVPEKEPAVERDRRWVQIKRPLIIVGGEVTIENTDLEWSNASKFYEAPFQLKANGGTLVIDDLGRQRVSPNTMLNRWIPPLERHVDFLTLRDGKKIEIPFEQLVVFSTTFTEKELDNDAFIRRIGYRAMIEGPSVAAYTEIFKRAAADNKVPLDEMSTEHILSRYLTEERPMRACEPRDLLNRVNDICRLKGRPFELCPELLDLAWNNYFGVIHSYESTEEVLSIAEVGSVAV